MGAVAARLFTDLVGPTALRDRLGDDAAGKSDLRGRIGLQAGERIEEEGNFFKTPVVGRLDSRGGHRVRAAWRLALQGLAQPVPTVGVEWSEPAP